MKNKLILSALTLALLTQCGGKKSAEGDYPANFGTIGDAGRVEYMLKTVTPDSLARFIIYGALGKDKTAKIDTLAIATNYAYERLKEKDLDSFSAAYDAVVSSLPLGDKMKLYMLAGSEDPQGLGYRLGLEYMSSIRDNNKSVTDVHKELDAFQKACGTDTAMYRRFMIGFQTALKVDHGIDVPEDIYKEFAQ